MELFSFYDIVTLVVLLVLFINIIMNKMKIKEPTETLLRDQLPTVSVLIPARNEAKNIGACLRSVLAQDLPRFEVIVLDDTSTDNTAQIVRDFSLTDDRVKLLSGRSIAPHWFGKPYAQYQAAQVSRGQYLLFLDADVILDRKVLTMMAAAARKRGAGIVSMFPYQIKEGFWEELLAPFKYFHLFLFFPTYAMDWPWEPLAAFANGQCMMIERNIYKKIGGHSTASESIREGVNISRTLKKRGGRIRLLSGAKIARAKVHGPPPALWEGLTRYLYSMAKRSILASLLLAFFYFFLFVLPAAKILYLPFSADFVSSQLIFPAIEVFLGIIMFLTAVGSFGLTFSQALMLPIGALMWIGMFGRAIIVAMGKEGIVWKDRTIKIP